MLTRKAVKNAFLKNTPDYKPTKRDIIREEQKQNVEYWKRVFENKKCPMCHCLNENHLPYCIDFRA